MRNEYNVEKSNEAIQEKCQRSRPRKGKNECETFVTKRDDVNQV
jgi:hypothetical protein